MSANEYQQLLQDALREIKRLRSERSQTVHKLYEPIAIVGMACRFPQADSPEQLFALSTGGRDGIRSIPADRWSASDYFDANPDAEGKMVTTSAGFLDDVRGFDAAFFRMSPREARVADPQQRLLLETTWTALERAAIPVDTLPGKSVGVFIGLSNLEYANVVRACNELGLIDSHFGTGNAASIAAGRIAYLLGTHGPTLTIDTACSSSLVAMHLAIKSLRDRECDLAVVGGANVMLLPETFIHFSNARMLAPDGRCKPFSKNANGYGRGEGCGVVILKRLNEALRDGEPIEAIVRGSCINHDGRSAGLTAPNGASQEAVIKGALRSAALDDQVVHFVEAHGTGTPLGDPIEAAALARAYGKQLKRDTPLWISAIKANIGHTEAAAGMAGIIHAVQCLKQRQLPPLLNFDGRSEHITADYLQFPTTQVDLSDVEGPIRGAVSSFGFSGSNAHVILEEFAMDEDPFAHDQKDKPTSDNSLLVLSAKSEVALQELAANVSAWWREHPHVGLPQLCHTLLHGRSHYPSRLAFEASDVIKCLDKLEQFAKGTSAHALAASSEKAQQYLAGDNAAAMRDSHTAYRRIIAPTYPFQRVEHWIASTDTQPSSTQKDEGSVESCIVSLPACVPAIGQQVVFGSAVISTAGWLHLISQLERCAQAPAVQLRSIDLLQTLVVSRSEMPSVRFELRSSANGESFKGFETSRRGSTPTLPHITGRLLAADTLEWRGGAWANGDRSTLEALESLESREPRQVYEQLFSVGVEFHSLPTCVERVSVSASECLVQLKTLVTDSADDLSVNRALAIDALIGCAASLLPGYSQEPVDAMSLLPTAVDEVDWFIQSGPPRYGHIRTQVAPDSHAVTADIFAWDADGRATLQLLGVRFEGLSVRELNAKSQTSEAYRTDKLNAEEREGLVLANHRLDSSVASTEHDRGNLQRLLEMSASERKVYLEEYLRQELAKEMLVPAEDIPVEQPLADLGLDSLMIFRMSIELESVFGVELDSRLLLGGLSLRQLTAWLLSKLEVAAAEERSES